MKAHRLSYVIFLVFFCMYSFGNWWLPVTDPVESNYALTAKEMVLSGDWMSPQIYGHYWYDKPIMIYWLIALSYKVLGITDFASRLPSTLFGAATVAFFYEGVRTISNRRLLALGSSLVLGTSLMVWVMAHGIITDMVLLWSSLAIFYYAYRGLHQGSTKHIVLSYLFAGIAVLTKGPVGIVLPGILFIVYAGVERSWSMVKRLFPWQGILTFLAVVLPWYGYMYVTHGSDFVNTFLGLHNVTRATESEHPEQNVWWYYLAIFLGASLPWTGAMIYGMIYGWRHKTSFYRYSMVMGWGVVAFYTLMATKYPTYSFISMIPFSFLGSWGLVKLLQPSTQRSTWWWILGPALLLWWSLGIASFFSPWGFWWIFRLIVLLGTAFVLGCYWYRKRFMIPVTIGICTVALYGILLQEALVPLVEMRSSVSYVKQVQSFEGDIYYYDGYAASISLYTGQSVVKVSAKPKDDKKRDTVKRSESWAGKYTMPTIEEEELIARLVSDGPVLVIVDKGGLEQFMALPFAQELERVKVTDRHSLFIRR